MNINKVQKYIERRKRRQRWISAVTVLGIIASMFTNALMANPADAMTGALICSQEEHTHTNECYITMPVHVGCAENAQEQHLHDQTCYDAEGKLVCNKEEYVIIHTHDNNCYDKDGNLICGMPEVEEHIHDASCYDAEGNVICGKREIKEHREHTEECYTTNEAGERVLTCTYPIAIRHQHAMACYDQTEAVLICGKEEHVHTDSCYEHIEEEPVQEEVTEEVPAETAVTEEVTEEPVQESTEETVERAAEVQTETAEEKIAEENTEETPAETVPEEKEETKVPADVQEETKHPETEENTEPAPTVIEEDGKKIVFMEEEKDEPAETVTENTEKNKVEGTEGEKPEEETTETVTEEKENSEEVLMEDEATSEEKKDEELTEDVKSEEEQTEEAEETASDDKEDSEEGDTEEVIAMPAVSFENADTDVEVYVTAEEGSFPAGTTMKVVPVAAEEVTDAVQSTTEKSVVEIQAVDISFWYGEEEIEPLKPINVVMKPKAVTAEADHTAVVHVKDEGETEVVVEETEGVQEEVTFDTPEFSVYAIVYTVDFHYEVNGNTYDYSIPGGGAVSLSDLIMKLGVLEKGTDINTFISDIQDISFTEAQYIWTGKINSDISVGYLKAEKELQIIYSSGLNEEQIAEIDAQIIHTGDWVLISLRPFTSDEVLTVTMNNGDTFELRVTDAQISTNVLTADGSTYRITVTYDEEAGIPDGTELTAREIEFASDEYNQLIGRIWTEANKEYFEVEEMRENYDESMGILPDVKSVNINMARFFDITLMHEGAPIEPKSPVQVEISYVQGLYSSEFTAPGVVHYLSDEKLEIIENVNTSVIHNEVTSFRYEQNSFSPVGTYIEQEIENSYVTANPAPVLSAVKDTKEQNVLLNDTMIEEIILKNTEGQLRDGQTEQPDTKDHTELSKPTGNKTLTANQDENGVKDGTYTLTLSVKGHSNVSSDTVVKKSNVLVVMDRSSSMISKTVNNDETRWYYGTKNTSIFRPDISASQGYQFYGIVNGVEVPLNVSADWNGNVTITYRSGTGWMGPTYTNYPGDAPIYVVSKKTRMMAEQEALGELYAQLLDKNNASGQTNDDIIEVAVISFGDQSFDKKSWSNETECGWTKGRDVSPLNTVTSSNRFTSGTNWEEALEYAYETINAKKAQDGTNEDYYVIFLTDGEPTAVRGDTGAAHTTDPVTGRITKGKGNIYAYNEAKDEAKKLVDNGYKFYNIFTYRTTEDPKYSVYLTNYAYGNGNENGDASTEAVTKYYTDAQTIDSLKNAFNHIFTQVENSIGHGNVSITDTLTTDAMTTTVVQGKTNGYVYTVKNAAEETLYTVTAAGTIDHPTVTFHVPGSATKDYTASVSEVGGKKVYSVMTAEGRTYKMALADINDQTGELVWDLSSVGILMNECTYNVSFVVWPDQEAYDYVAALNNGLPGYTWSDSASTYEDLRSTKGYEKGGVERFPSIVKYPNGTFAVLTNSDQKLHYSVIETTSDGTTTNTNVTGPFYQELPLPEPMPLTASASQIRKVWEVERDPGVLAQLLYNPDGTAKEYSIDFEILQKVNGQDAHYTDVKLGWDAAARKYVWDEDSKHTVNYNGHPVEIGTQWASDFSIATGLMLSTDRMNAVGLDKTAYPSAEFNRKTYYILEAGHDYTIKEPGLTYEFDFEAPVYHPMLVDGVLKNVKLTKNGDTYSIAGIDSIDAAEGGMSSLVITNTLRGYIHLNKIVVDENGTQQPQDDTKFAYTVTLNNTDPVFEGDHIPWYGINGLFYHDADFNYYQAEPAAQSGTLTLKDESGAVYTAACSGTFNPDIIGPTQVTYTDNSGNQKTIALYGNQMMASNGARTASAALKINQTEILNIANVPVNTAYTITETQAAGYELYSVTRKVGDNAEENLSGLTVDGTIVANADNNITYKNRSVTTDITVQKLDESGNGLAGAVFQLRVVGDNGVETLASGIEGIDGLGTVSKQANGETKTFESSFESTGEIQKITHLPDGTYRLYEVYVPAGYISTYKYIQFDIADRTMQNVTTDTGNTDRISFEAASGSGTDAKLALLQITNEAGAELPHTGGTGTVFYTCTGMIMILSAAILYIWRRRKVHCIS